MFGLAGLLQFGVVERTEGHADVLGIFSFIPGIITARIVLFFQVAYRAYHESGMQVQ